MGYSVKPASMRLLVTTFVAAIFVFLIILTARIWGLGRTYTEFKHPFFDGATPYMVAVADTDQEIDKDIQLKKDVILWVDARVSADQILFLLPVSEDVRFLDAKKAEQDAHPDKPILKGWKLSAYTWNELHRFYPEAPTLRDEYLKHPGQRFIVNVVDNVVNIHKAVVDALKDTDADNRTLIQSDTLVVMTSIKDLKPEWVYGTSQADIMRFLSFDSMWILPTTQYSGDVFIAPFKVLDRPAFNDDVIAEMRRRHQKVYLGPITTRVQLDDAKRLNADGYITKNLSELLSWLDQSQSH